LTVLEPLILHTSSGGKEWAQELLPRLSGYPVGAIFFRNPQKGVAAAGHHLFYTLDGGVTWRPSGNLEGCSNSAWLGSEYDEPLSFFFYDDDLGWLGSVDGFLLRTVDGGKSWCSLGYPVKPNEGGGVGYFGTVYFDTPRHGWYLGKDEFVHETNDSGVSWTKVEGLDFVYSLFCGSGHSWALSDGKLYRTE
jgi:photosystem II stability/assembly factor-like uncharacterized protein